MKKKLIALAVAAGMAAPMIASAEVTLYGRAHVSIDSLDDGADSSMQVSSNASRIGFRGKEDIGGGLTAKFQVESTVNFDSGASGNGFGTRNTYVGLGGGWGEVRLGHHDTPFKTLSRRLDMFGDTIGDSRNLLRPKNAEGTGSGWEERFRNGIMYFTPKLGGFQAVLHYSTNTGAATATGPTANDDDAYSASVGYTVGGLTLSAAYELHNLNADDDESAIRVGAGYKMGDFTVNALWHSASDQGGVAGADRDIWGLGVAYKMGANTIKAQYYTADEMDGAPDTGADMWAIGLDHSLSKTTRLYLAYAQTSNDANASFSMSGGGGHQDDVGAVQGEDASGFSLGIIHNF